MAERELDSIPGMRGLYGKAFAGWTTKPVLQRVPGIGGHFGGGERKLPDEQLLLTDVEIDREHLSAYDRVCGFRLSDHLPPTYPHMLAFPLAMELMTASDFPFPVIGLVHIRNVIEQLRPIGADEELTVRAWTGELEDHPKGTQFGVHAEVTVGDEPVWRTINTYLRKGGGSGDGDKKERGDEPVEPDEPGALWTVPDDIGRRYAKVSGDSNPIHLRRSTALAFGMPRPIAHGMWMKARCLAALEGHLPDAFSVDVAFKLPVQLPAKVAFRTWEEGAVRAFSLRDAKSGKPHVTGTVEAAS
jgi:acyl dehydratase